MFKNIFALLMLTAGITVAMQFIAPHTSYVSDYVQFTPSQSRADDATRAVKGATANAQPYTEYISKWEDALGVSITTDPGYSSNSNYNWEIVGAEAHQSEIAYYQSFDEEMAKYSAAFFANADVNRIVLVDNIKTASGIAVLGFADPITGEIFFNMEAARAQSGLIKSTIHHEIAHIALYAVFGSDMYNLTAWNAIANQSTQTVSRVENKGHSFPEAGFVSSYARTSTAEDMAEVFAYVMTDEYAELLPAAQVVDHQIDAKVTFIADAISTLDKALIARE